MPEVAVPELPQDPALWPYVLLGAGYFETIRLSDEDSKRAEYYAANARRTEILANTSDIPSFLKSLNMRAVVAPFDDNGRGRIAQLINKSNQFNLTTRRYTEADVAARARDPHWWTLQIRLADRFGDNGMIGVVICELAGAECRIDTWLMSCRVLGRGVENLAFNEILAFASSAGARRIVGQYIPTARNSLVREHYAKLGFAHASNQTDGSSLWYMDVAAASPREHFIAVEHAEPTRPLAPAG
jgi:FkbH-like protein